MRHRIFESGIYYIDLAYPASRKVLQHLFADLHRICVERLINRRGIILAHLIAKPREGISALCANRIDDQIILIPVIIPHQLDDVGIVSACKSPVSRDHDHSLLRRIVCLQERVIDISCFGKHRNHRLIHAVKIRLGFLCTSLRPLQFNGGNKLHGLCNLLRTLYGALTSLYVSH